MFLDEFFLHKKEENKGYFPSKIQIKGYFQYKREIQFDDLSKDAEYAYMSTDNKYFTVEHPNPAVKAGLSKLVEAVLKTNKFPAVFGDALKMSLLTSPYITKVSYNYKLETYPTYNPEKEDYGTTDEIVGKTEIKHCDPFGIRPLEGIEIPR